MFEHIKSFPRAFQGACTRFLEGIVYYYAKLSGYLSVSYKQGYMAGQRKKVKG